MEIYTIGFTKRSAADFFGALKSNGIRQLVDIRISNTSQLAGFAKKDDLAFFLTEICGAAYIHEPLLAPTPDLLTAYRKRLINWEAYAGEFLALMSERRIEQGIDRSLFADPTVLLCSEPTAVKCHRRLVVEYLAEKWGELEAVHL